jgi:predicted nuclease with TOPRIM domain
MEALRIEPVGEGETEVSSVQVVSQVLSKNSSNVFLKSVGIKSAPSSRSSASNESELREQLAAEAKAAVQGELDDLKKRSEEAKERPARTQKEMKKLTEKSNKAMEENNALLKRILSINNASLT